MRWHLWSAGCRDPDEDRDRLAKKRMDDLQKTTQNNYAAHHRKLEVGGFSAPPDFLPRLSMTYSPAGC